MNKAEFISELTKKLNVSNKEATRCLEGVLDCIVKGLVKHQKISFVGFGSFNVKKVNSRTVLNPRTRKPMTVPAKNRPTFKAGNTLKNALNK